MNPEEQQWVPGCELLKGIGVIERKEKREKDKHVCLSNIEDKLDQK